MVLSYERDVVLATEAFVGSGTTKLRRHRTRLYSHFVQVPFPAPQKRPMGDSEIRLGRSTSQRGTPSVLVGLFALLLVASGCTPRLGSRGLPSLPREVIIDVVEENYDVRGRTVEEIGQSLNASAAAALAPGLRGLHHWDIRWSYVYRQGISNCEIVSVPIEITSRIILPRWTQREGADPELVAMWDEYITALRAHEFTHREFSYLAARDFSRVVGRLRTPLCATMPILAESTGQRIFDTYGDRNREFDDESRGTINWPLRAPVTVSPQQQQRQDAAPQAIRKEAGLMVPMRDGVRLSTDLYFPADATGPFSTVLMRTPYGKDRDPPYRGTIPLLVEAGYAVAFQDTRGRGVSLTGPPPPLTLRRPVKGLPVCLPPQTPAERGNRP